MGELEKDYELLRKKHALPKFEELDAEFDIHCIEDGKLLIKDIREKIAEKSDNFCMIIEEVLQPDTKISNLYESRVFSDSDKEKIFRLFKRLMMIKRKAAFLMLKNSDKEDAEFIRESFKEWHELKEQLSPMFEKLVEAWETETDIKEELSYFG